MRPERVAVDALKHGDSEELCAFVGLDSGN